MVSERKCNIFANAIEKHAKKYPDKIAYIFENEQRIVKRLSYCELDTQANSLSAALKKTGVKKGDVIRIYMPMIPEAFVSLFACSKIGAVRLPVFSGFGGHALSVRLRDSGAKILITADKTTRRGVNIDLKERWLDAIETSKISRIITVGKSDNSRKKEITSYDEFVKSTTRESCQTEWMDSEDPLFILYTSGTTGMPKGTVQVHGGFMLVCAQQTAYVIDMRPDDTLFWYADIGWITGQTWVVYGSAIVGGTSLIHDGALDYPTPDNWCRLIDEYKVSIFGTPPPP
jgi:acetyl-CoA synthetase